MSFLKQCDTNEFPTLPQGAFSPPDQSQRIPLLLLSFDEAQQLTISATGRQNDYTPFSELRRALRLLRSVDGMFAMFCSTTGHIFQFSPLQVEQDPSRRVHEGILRVGPPFVELGWDQMAVAHPDGVAISSVTSMDNIVRLGRPLWVFSIIASREGSASS